MGRLDDHFGNNAELEPEVLSALTNHLVKSRRTTQARRGITVPMPSQGIPKGTPNMPTLEWSGGALSPHRARRTTCRFQSEHV